MKLVTSQAAGKAKSARQPTTATTSADIHARTHAPRPLVLMIALLEPKSQYVKLVVGHPVLELQPQHEGNEVSTHSEKNTSWQPTGARTVCKSAGGGCSPQFMVPV